MQVEAAGQLSAVNAILAAPSRVPLALLPDASAGADSVSVLLMQLDTPQLTKIIGELMQHRLSPEGAPAREFLQRAISAVAAQDLPRALDAIQHLLVRYPEQVDAVRWEPAFAPIRGDVEVFLQRHLTSAKLDSEQKIAIATEASGREPPPALSLANQLIATDRHVNVLLAGDLALFVINSYVPVAPAPGRKRAGRAPALPEALTMLYQQAIELVANVGKRLPTRLFLLIWFIIGLISGFFETVALPFEIWGAGSIGLIGFGTYRRLRKAANGPTRMMEHSAPTNSPQHLARDSPSGSRQIARR